MTEPSRLAYIGIFLAANILSYIVAAIGSFCLFALIGYSPDVSWFTMNGHSWLASIPSCLSLLVFS